MRLKDRFVTNKGRRGSDGAGWDWLGVVGMAGPGYGEERHVFPLEAATRDAPRASHSSRGRLEEES